MKICFFSLVSDGLTGYLATYYSLLCYPYQPNYFAKNEINSTDSICFETASSSELNSLIQNLFNFRNDQKNFPEALRTKCDDSLISCG